jgi:hypothetical protein
MGTTPEIETEGNADAEQNRALDTGQARQGAAKPRRAKGDDQSPYHRDKLGEDC